MRILQIFNKYLHTGGEEMAVNQISSNLSRRHEVRDLFFESSAWAGHSSILDKCRQGLLMAWNPISIRRVRAEIREFQPDLILLHNLMPVGSAYLYPSLLSERIPVIQFIHNFRPFSVNGYCWAQGQLCPEGLRRNFIPEILAGSWQDSKIRSAWYACLLQLQHAAGVYQRIHGWIAISNFMAQAFVEAGIDPQRVEVIPHCWETGSDGGGSRSQQSDEPSFLFLGRLSEEKGVRVLLDAWRIHEQSNLPGKLVIAGEGPLAEEVERACGKLDRAERLSFVHGERKQQLLRDCTAMVIPSVWWEPLGLVIFEAYENRKPVLAASSGGIVDHVFHGQNGWLHKPGDAAELASHLALVASNPSLASELGNAGRTYLETNTTELWLDRFDAFAKTISVKIPDTFDTAPRRANAAATRRLRILTYLADQNPKLGRSLGISRMTQMLMEQLVSRDDIHLDAIVSNSSMPAPEGCDRVLRLPWSTRTHASRAITDNLHSFFHLRPRESEIWYFPKGFMPRFPHEIRSSVATIHDTIIQYYQDNYPAWRTDIEYKYWRSMLCNTLRFATAVTTVSYHAKQQIESFIARHDLPQRDIHVTYEPCVYESVPQPELPEKSDFVLHLGSKEPHKRTEWLVLLWIAWLQQGQDLPVLHIVGKVPEAVEDLVHESERILQLPFLDDDCLADQFLRAKALIFPSEIEGFGLPAIEAYYLGTPVCYALGTSVQEVLEPSTRKGGFDLKDPDTLRSALHEVLAMPPEEIRSIGLELRERFHSSKFVRKMVEVFSMVKDLELLQK